MMATTIAPAIAAPFDENSAAAPAAVAHAVTVAAPTAAPTTTAAATDLELPDCAHVYYVKQLSPSDAACSKQIKLPKTEARKFVGDLRHKQSTVVTFVDPLGEAWEFLCTCYGCQYALSRVGNFCNAFRLKAGQFMLFYADARGRLVSVVFFCVCLGSLGRSRCVLKQKSHAAHKPPRPPPHHQQTPHHTTTTTK
jgi:hypothetical protein